MPRPRQISSGLSNDGPILARFVRESGSPRTPQAWGFLKPGLLIASLTLLSACRLDMHVQPRQNPLSRSDFFTDQRSERPPVEGTVARGQLHEDTYFYTGKAGNGPGDYMPFPVTRGSSGTRTRTLQHLLRSVSFANGRRQRLHPFARFCAQAAVIPYRRGSSKAPLGYFFDVITNGFGIMPDYASQIPPEDRWKIVAYLRALQLSQNATRADVPAGQARP